MESVSESPELAKSLSFSAMKKDTFSVTGSAPIKDLLIQQRHVRTRSASSPVRPGVMGATKDTQERLASAPEETLAQHLASLDSKAVPVPDAIHDTFMGGLDKWNSIFKNAILDKWQSEFMGAKKSLLKYQSELERAERDKLDSALAQSKLETKQLKTELEMERKSALKGETILNSAMAGFLRNKTKVTVSTLFARWRSIRMTRNKTRLADHMASIHHQATTMRKIIGGWRLAAGSTWKIATEKRIKKEAEKCIGDMSKAYEAQILTLTQQLESALQRVQKAESAKEEQQDELKRALMRGVCALNMEAMSVLRGSSAATSLPLPVSSPQQHSMPRVEPEPSAPVPSDTQAAYEALMVPRTKDKVNFTLPKTSETPSKSSPSQRQSKEYGKRILVTRHQ